MLISQNATLNASLKIPFNAKFAILKVVFDHIESLKPWGFLLGNLVATKSKLKLGFV